MWRTGFTSKALQAAFDNDLQAEKIRLTRIMAVMAAFLNVAFCWLDTYAIPSALHQVWLIRAGMNVLLLGCLLMTWRQIFHKVYPLVVFVTYAGLGLGINAIILLAKRSELAAEVYYGGLLLITFGLYTLTYIGLWLSMSISGMLLFIYLAVSVIAHDFLRDDRLLVLLANLFFFFSTTFIGMVALGVRNRYARENYLLRQSLERDIELQIEEKHQASLLAEHDGLTGLLNRIGFDARANELLADAELQRQEVAVLFIDLDKFKPINDRCGHEVGDRVLRDIGQRLLACLREGDCLARFGGDEFVVALPLPQKQIDAVVRKMRNEIEQPIQVRGDQLRVSASIGAASFPQQGRDLAGLIRAADLHMYRSKHERRATGHDFRNAQLVGP